ncbi:MAG TPA: ATP-binding protein [Thiotrichaceae bacterium]|nr:ATP-binding protein [Thiotrichaceae bacterium]
MILKAIKYCRNKADKNEWTIRGNPIDNEWLDLNQINLIVGRNASGKTKTIQIIREMADLLAGDTKLSQLIYDTSTYELMFEDGNDKIEYFLDFKNGGITREIFKINGTEKLNRTEAKCNLFYEKFGQYSDFNVDNDFLVISSTRDTTQHPFFKGLYNWGKNLSHYRFGDKLGKNVAIKDINRIKEDDDVDLKDGDDVIGIFVKGEKSFHNQFIDSVINDMNRLGYPLDEITVNSLKRLPFGFGLSVQETELKEVTDQMDMSQGMFRALSLLIQLNYSLLAQIPSCILIDDIGEGLDYERAKALIELIIEKLKGSSVQVIMTTNDQFVMDKVPLEYWSVIRRLENKSIFYNYINAKQTFDDFVFTGLNNFDFYASEFFIHGFDDYVKDVI